METENGRDAPRTKGGKVRLRSLDDLDHRTNAAKRAATLVSGLEADLGGANQLSTGQREIIKRIALVGALAEDAEVRWLEGEEIEVANYAILANAQRRLLVTVGLERKARDVTPTDDDRYRRFVEAYERLDREGVPP